MDHTLLNQPPCTPPSQPSLFPQEWHHCSIDSLGLLVTFTIRNGLPLTTVYVVCCILYCLPFSRILLEQSWTCSLSVWIEWLTVDSATRLVSAWSSLSRLHVSVYGPVSLVCVCQCMVQSHSSACVSAWSSLTRLHVLVHGSVSLVCMC